ncbi:TlpA family protein disulfide reductase [Flaviramulus sp. BrNp1-15]|uniref:TlpA family protein disulfide reductase n=1 Tax=Flaviramulus sp. BrNp1-15 TaxID=2916754 RepID=UPI001EE883C8|nr:TlpA disulfide reductase family protein [Flaviramulus sp. BrNp1-15]ULC58761.1 TlpA family protein disulfide reductase [Flaviramulus sp. BrNp1-15]
MKFLKILFIVCFLFSPSLFHGQIKISENIQESSIAKSENNALYFVDFWATWCKPCIHVSKYLESLQRQYPEDFYILSLSQESPEVVKKFLLKHQINLAIATDYEGETFTKNNIYSLPYGILYNAQGEKLWEGHPAEFKNYNIDGYLSQHKKRVSVDTFFKVHKYQQTIVKEPEMPKKDFEYSVVKNTEDQSGFQIIDEKNYVQLKGSLQDIIGYALNIYRNQIEISNDLNKYYTMYFKKSSKSYLNMEDSILDALKLKRSVTEKEGEVLILDIDNPNFWDTNQIDWEGNSQKYLIGDSDIQADNVSLNEVTYKLSGLLDMPIVFNKKNKDNSLHDWQIHYKYFELMTANLNDYGLKIQKKFSKYPQYVITKKRSR